MAPERGATGRYCRPKEVLVTAGKPVTDASSRDVAFPLNPQPAKVETPSMVLMELGLHVTVLPTDVDETSTEA